MLMGHNTIFSPYFRARKVTGSLWGRWEGGGGVGREGIGEWGKEEEKGKGWGEKEDGGEGKNEKGDGRGWWEDE